MISFLFQIFLKPVIEDRNMELARKCSELISDVSDRDYLHSHICISSFKCIYIYETYFLKYIQCSMCSSKAQIIKAQKIIEKHRLLWYCQLFATEEWAFQSTCMVWSTGPRKEFSKCGSQAEGVCQENTLATFIRKMWYFFWL